MSVSVAIPTLDGAATLDTTLAAVRSQSVAADVVVLDSSSTDGTRDVARRHGARVETIAREAFGHGSARNHLMRLADGDRVAFLTQDAEPAGPDWLSALLGGLDVATDVELSYGRYLPPPEAAASQQREFAEFFGAMGTTTRVWRAADLPDLPTPGPATFASSANLCLTRRAWSRTPFRDVAYAEDQLLAQDLLAAGGAKAYVPSAAVRHGHAYSPIGRLRRSFDEFRALHELYAWSAPAEPRIALGTVRAEVRRDRNWARTHGLDVDRETWRSVGHHGARVVGAALGTRAAALPGPVRTRLSAEGRA